ncbi:MAG: ABC transporter ATP-binding protein [Clostridia bacterium]|nr:ABC transporter ATP-binding protein [Clostridia bacterium]
MEHMIDIQNLSVTFDRPVVRDFSLTVRGNGVLCLRGPSGAGKTTILNAVASLVPYTGTIAFSGKLAYLFQDDRLLAHLRAGENVRLTAQSEPAARYYLHAFGVDEFADKKPRNLSGGMARRCALARCFAYGGDVFLLDEPFRGLDGDNALRVKDEIRKLAQNAVILLVTHDEDDVRDLNAREAVVPLL